MIKELLVIKYFLKNFSLNYFNKDLIDEITDFFRKLLTDPPTKTPPIFKASLFASACSVINEIALSFSVPTNKFLAIFNEMLS